MSHAANNSVAVTGASGHIGGNLVRALLAEGRPVRTLVYRDTAALEGLDVMRCPGSILDKPSLEKAFAGADVVYHLAAVITLKSTPDPEAHRVNVEGTRNVVEACKTCGVRRLVHFSSIHAFSPHPLDEMVDEARPLCNGPRLLPYDRSKAEGERVVAEAIRGGLDAVVVNPTGVIGPVDFKPSAMGQVLLDLYYRRLPALVDGGFNWVDVRDVVAGAMAAERRGTAGQRYLLAGHYRKLRQIAELVEQATGVRVPRLVVPIAVARLGVPFAVLQSWVTGGQPKFTFASLHALQHHQQVDCGRACEELGYAPRPFDETVTDSIAWFRQYGYIK